MEEQPFEKLISQQDIPTCLNEKIMTKEFTGIYQQALRSSNLKVNNELKYRNVSIYKNDHIHELFTSGDKSLPHLVLLHGFGASSLCHILMFQHLYKNFQVHALDSFGIGLSSRGTWHEKMTKDQARDYFIDALEQWRKVVGLDSFILAGHSFGGYLSVQYIERYPSRVKQLVLLSPAGTCQYTQEEITKLAGKFKGFYWLAEKLMAFNLRPSTLYNTWWIGGKLLDIYLRQKYKFGEKERVVWTKCLKYVLQCNSGSQNAPYLFFDFPLQPKVSIESVLGQAKHKIKIDFMYGDDDYLQSQGAYRLAQSFENIKVHVIKNASHEIMVDNPIQVCEIIKQITNSVLQQ